jgi:cytochrome c553
MKSMLLVAVTAFSLMGSGVAGAADAQAGQAKAKSCAACHGPNGEGSAGNPPLAGMNQERFIQAMKEYKSGKRPHPAMKVFAAQMDDKDTANLAAYYASLKKK